MAFAGTEGSDVPNPDDENIAKVMRLRPELSKEQAAALAAQLPKSGTTIGQLGKAGLAAVKAGLATVAHPLTPFTQADPVSLIMQADPRLTMDEARIIAQPQGIASLQAEAEGDLGNQGSAIPTTAVAPPATTPPSGDYLSNTGATKAPDAAPQGIAKLAADKVAAPPAVDIDAITKRVGSGYNMDEINKQRADIAAQIAKLNAEQNDPSTQNRDRLAAFLSAAGAGTSLASGARLGGAAVNELNATRQAARAAQLKDLQTTADSRAKELMEMGMKRTDAIERAYAEANQTAAVTRGQDIQATSAANQTGAQLAIAEARDKTDRFVANLTATTNIDVAKLNDTAKLLAAQKGITEDQLADLRAKAYTSVVEPALMSIREGVAKRLKLAKAPVQNAEPAFETEVAKDVRNMLNDQVSLYLGKLPGTTPATPTANLPAGKKAAADYFN